MLSRNPAFETSDAEDNQKWRLIPKHRFRAAASNRGHVLVEGERKLLQRVKEGVAPLLKSLKETESLGPKRLQKGLEEWNTEQGLVLFRGKVYVPKDPELRRRIVQLHHDTLPAGHPGRWKTYELVSRNY